MSNAGMLSPSWRERSDGGAASWHPHSAGRCEPRVPRLVHFIWLGSPVSEAVAHNIESFAKMNPTWRVILWLDRLQHASRVRMRLTSVNVSARPAGAVELLRVGDFASHFSTWAHIEREAGLSAKSNYLRLEIVNLKGGVYTDTDAVAVRPFDDFGDLFRHAFLVHGGDICNCMFAFGRGSPFLRFALAAAVEACDVHHSCGNGPGRGPAFLTGAVAAYQPDDVVFIWGAHVVYAVPSVPARVSYHTFEGSWNGGHQLFKRVCPLGKDSCREVELGLQRTARSLQSHLHGTLLLCALLPIVLACRKRWCGVANRL